MRRLAMSAIVAIAVSVVMPLQSSSSARDGSVVRPPPVGPEPVKEAERTAGTRAAGEALPTEAPRPEGVAGGFVYVPIDPFRTWDSRMYVNGVLPAGSEEWFTVLTDINDVVRIPVGAVAVTYNLAVAGTYGPGGGFLALYPADIVWPGNASINWTAPGTILSNGGTVAIGYLDGPGQVAVRAGGPTGMVGADYVIDITGYYI